MHRSASTTRIPNDYISIYQRSPSPKLSTSLTALSLESTHDLPMYEPLSEVAKKERGRAKYAENAIHLIPFVLLFCALILWLLSNPEIDVPMRVDSSIAAKIEGLTIEGVIDSDGTHQGGGYLPLDWGDLHDGDGNTQRLDSDNKFR